MRIHDDSQANTKMTRSTCLTSAGKGIWFLMELAFDFDLGQSLARQNFIDTYVGAILDLCMTVNVTEKYVVHNMKFNISTNVL